MKILPRAVVSVTLTVAFAFALAWASNADLPPSNHTADSGNVAHKSNAEAVSGQNSPNGRFQLVSADTFIAVGTNTTTVPVVLRIDTATGKTSMLVLMQNTNGNTFGFTELKDLFPK